MSGMRDQGLESGMECTMCVDEQIENKNKNNKTLRPILYYVF